MRIRLALLALLACAIGGPLAHAACTTDNAVFTDDFKDATGGWDTPDQLTFGPKGGTVIIPKGSFNNYVLNAAFRVRDADICVDAIVPTSTMAKSNMGLIFAASDYQNFFMLMITASKDGGKYAFYRRLDGKWVAIIAETTPLAAASGPLIKTAPGASNRLEVVLKNNLATMFVNGTQVSAIRLQAPKTDLRFGLYAEISAAAGDQGETSVFQNFIVDDVK